MIYLKDVFLLTVALSIVAITGCSLLEIEQMPTKSKMQGVWEVVEAYDENGNDIVDDINFPVTAFHLSSDNGVLSTAGPMIMMLVYGPSKYTSIASKIDQTFNYADFSTTNGEWFIEGGFPSRFTLEMKLEGLPGQKSLTTLLDLLGISKNYLDVTIYHKFKDVSVTFDLFTDTTMTWEFDNVTTAVYNKKDSYGEYVSWNGFQTDNFSHCKFVFRKRIGTLESVIKNAAK
jgi:hypothetical protein